MTTILIFHIIAGSLALVAGYVALFAKKANRTHRRSGMVFVATMLAMTMTGALVAAFRAIEISVVVALIAAYFVITGLRALRPMTPRSRRDDLLIAFAALAVGLSSIAIAIQGPEPGGSGRDGVPLGLFVFFGSITVASALADFRVIRRGVLEGAARLRRHLWRMCFALWIAATSFFLGQADEFPQMLRDSPLRYMLVLVVPAVAIFWLWRVRTRRVAQRTHASAAASVAR